jgi:hypothetical protein
LTDMTHLIYKVTDERFDGHDVSDIQGDRRTV